MKNLLFLIAGATAVAAYIIATRARTAEIQQPVEELAHKLQDAWADHHTIA